MRKELKEFAEQCEMQLKLNDNKPHWSKLTLHSIEKILNKHQGKLLDAVCKNNHKAIIKHSVAMANYAMFLADNAKNKIGDRG